MKLYEFQTKELFRKHGIPTPSGGVASSVDDAAAVAVKLGVSAWVMKAQILAGGRRAGHFQARPEDKGGVRFVSSLDDVRAAAEQMLGHVLVTEQTGPSGTPVRRVYVEQACVVARELYLAMLVDRRSSRVTLIASAQGGTNIESVAATSPDSILKVAIDPLKGLEADAARATAAALGLSGEQADAAVHTMQAMYDMFVSLDASLVEINPLAVTDAGEVIALDATLTLDDNALFRHDDVKALRDEGELEWGELAATQHGLNYVKLDGNIGSMSSGAGLAMATLDVIKFYGGEPANFLDVPPAVEVERVRQAFTLLLSDPDVEAILVNVIGGGIMRCDTIADGMILASREIPVRIPLVVRLAGVNAEFAQVRLKDSGLAVTFADDMADAAAKAVSAATDTKLRSRRSWWQRVQGLLTEHDAGSERTPR